MCKQYCNFSHFSWNCVWCCTASSTYCLPHFIHLLTFLFLSLKPFNQVMWQSLIEKPQKNTTQLHKSNVVSKHLTYTSFLFLPLWTHCFCLSISFPFIVQTLQKIIITPRYAHLSVFHIFYKQVLISEIMYILYAVYI